MTANLADIIAVLCPSMLLGSSGQVCCGVTNTFTKDCTRTVCVSVETKFYDHTEYHVVDADYSCLSALIAIGKTKM